MSASCDGKSFLYKRWTASWMGMSEVASVVAFVATIIDSAAAWKDKAFAEYLGQNVAQPDPILRCGHYNLNFSLGDPPELYGLCNDPGELHNLAADRAHCSVVKDLRTRLLIQTVTAGKVLGNVSRSRRVPLRRNAATEE